MNSHCRKSVWAALIAALMLAVFLPACAAGGEFVFANGDTEAFLDRDLTRPLGTIDGESVLYMLGTARNDAGAEVAQVVFAFRYILRTAWVDARYVRSMSAQELAEYTDRAQEGIYYGEDAYLLNAGFAEAKATAEPAIVEGFVLASEAREGTEATQAPAVPVASLIVPTAAPTAPAGFEMAGPLPVFTAAPVPQSGDEEAAIGLNFHFDENYTRWREQQQGGSTAPVPQAAPAESAAEPGGITAPEGFTPVLATEQPENSPLAASFAVEEPEATAAPAVTAADTGTEAPQDGQKALPATAFAPEDDLKLNLAGVYSGCVFFDGSEPWERMESTGDTVAFCTAVNFRVDGSAVCDLFPVTADETVLPRIRMSGDNLLQVVLPVSMGIADEEAFRSHLAASPFGILFYGREETAPDRWYLLLTCRQGGAEHTLIAGPVYDSSLEGAVNLVDSFDARTALQSFVALEWLTAEQTSFLSE